MKPIAAGKPFKAGFAGTSLKDFLEARTFKLLGAYSTFLLGCDC